ncbi:MAG TPA: alpha/beta hydrolase, partial [Porticoccus sp.]|nr:alpha/beta hydrolase [Porticoccus sp.]
MKTPLFLRNIKFLGLMVLGIIMGRAASKKLTHQTYEYALREGVSLELDLFLPESGASHSNKPCPLIIWFHGGGWQMGSRESIELAAVKQVARGYAVASVSYSLTDVALWPAQAHEAKAAVRWLRANAGKFNINPEQFVAWGMSAGGHIAAILGTSADVEELNGELGNEKISNAVQAVIAFYPPTDFLQMVNDGLLDHFA